MNKTISRNLAQYFLYFILYSIIGWIYEVFLEVVVYRWGFSNRGALFGPYCIIYGVGALILILLFSGLKKKKLYIGKLLITPVLVFLGIVIVTTVIELIGSYIMEYLTGSWAWDYQRFAFHFQGRIALNPSIRFGIGGMVILYLLQPAFEKWIRKLSDWRLFLISGIIGALFLIDVIAFFLK